MKRLPLCNLLLLVLTATPAMGYESMYKPTPVGEVEIKNLPSRLALETKEEGSYFDQENGLFRRLFRYISRNDVAMTVPVEAEIQPSVMRFFVGRKHRGTRPPSEALVSVVELPARQVLSIGLRGGYDRKQFEDGRKALEQWMSHQEDWVADGEAYAVYWNGPLVPAWFKRSEVHLPVRPADSAARPEDQDEAMAP